MVAYIQKHQKVICWMLGIVFVLSLIPIFIVAGYDCAAGDDFNYGADAHKVFLASGSVIEAVKAAAATSIGTWYGWQGTWFDCFVFCLHPEVFSDNAYVIVPYIFLMMHIVGFLMLSHHFIRVRWEIEGVYWIQIGLLFLIFELQLMPSPKNGIFWWVGCVHYIMPMFMAVIGIVSGDNYLLFHRKRDFFGLLLISLLAGGVTYPAALLLPICVFLLWLEGYVIGKKRDKRNVLLLIPFVALMIGLVISVMAPGNAVRASSELEKEAQQTGGIADTIIKSFGLSVKEGIGSFVLEKGFIIILLLIVIPLTLATFRMIKEKKREYFEDIFGHPLLFLLVMFCINASVYAPRVYSGGVVSPGYFDFNFLTFSVCLISSEVYVLGWLFFCIGLLNVGKNSKVVNICWNVVIVISVLCIAFFSRHSVKQYTDYICLEYYLTGQAEDYREQIKLQRYLLEGDELEVVVPEINHEQGPLMQMPIVNDPDNVDNIMVAGFFDKNRVWSIPRNEWMELYRHEHFISETIYYK